MWWKCEDFLSSEPHLIGSWFFGCFDSGYGLWGAQIDHLQCFSLLPGPLQSVFSYVWFIVVKTLSQGQLIASPTDSLASCLTDMIRNCLKWITWSHLWSMHGIMHTQSWLRLLSIAKLSSASFAPTPRLSTPPFSKITYTAIPNTLRTNTNSSLSLPLSLSDLYIS
jgi:hypothetical protein